MFHLDFDFHVFLSLHFFKIIDICIFVGTSQMMNKNGFPMLNIPYEKRDGYYNALEWAQVNGEEDVFFEVVF